MLFENINLFSANCFVRFLLPFEIWESILPHPVYLHSISHSMLPNLGSWLNILLIQMVSKVRFTILITILTSTLSYNSTLCTPWIGHTVSFQVLKNYSAIIMQSFTSTGNLQCTFFIFKILLCSIKILYSSHTDKYLGSFSTSLNVKNTLRFFTATCITHSLSC